MNTILPSTSSEYCVQRNGSFHIIYVNSQIYPTPLGFYFLSQTFPITQKRPIMETLDEPGLGHTAEKREENGV